MENLEFHLLSYEITSQFWNFFKFQSQKTEMGIVVLPKPSTQYLEY